MLNKIKVNLLPVIIIVTVLIIGFGLSMMTMSKQISSLSTKVTSEQRISAALNDSVRYYLNKNNEIVAEKLTLQGKLKEVNDKNNILSDNQKRLMTYINDINKKYTLIVAANIKLQVIIDSLKGRIGTYDSTRHELSFKDTTKYLIYDMTVTNVLQYKSRDSELFINKLVLPNEQKIDFHWDKSRAGYPVAFSVTNTNKYFKIVDIDSYAIPELDKNKVKPTGWQKVNKWFEKTGGKVAIFGVGVGAGAIAAFLISK